MKKRQNLWKQHSRKMKNLAIENYIFEKTQSFKYLGATTTENNDWSIKICNRINKGKGHIFLI